MCARRSSKAISQNAILAPQQGVSRDEKGEPTALVVDAKGIARLRVLKTSRTMGDKWLVTDGLKAGDKLIVEGLQNVRAGHGRSCRARRFVLRSGAGASQQ